MMKLTCLSVCSKLSLLALTLTAQHFLQPGSKYAGNKQPRLSVTSKEQPESCSSLVCTLKDACVHSSLRAVLLQKYSKLLGLAPV